MYRLSAALLLAAVPVLADERTFTVSIDGRPAGDLIVSYQTRSDGTTAVTVRTDWRADRPTPISLDYRGTETWKDGRLVRLDGSGVQDGRKGGITLVAGADGFALKAGVKEVSIREAIWPTSGASPPDPDARPLVVDAVTGEVQRTKVETVGPERVTAAGKLTPATRYRVTAGSARWDVWYDDQKRLVRRTWTRDGRTVTAELTGRMSD